MRIAVSADILSQAITLRRTAYWDDPELARIGRMDLRAATRQFVVQALADLATSPEAAPAPGSPIPEIAGPREENLADMAVLLAARRGDSVKIEAVTNPADPDHELYEDGGLLPGPDATLAGPTFEEWLDFSS